MEEDKILISSYLNSSEDDFYLSIGRMLIASKYEAYKASADDKNRLRTIVDNFFEEELRDIREIVCDELKLGEKISSNNGLSEYDLALLIVGVLYDLKFSPIPVSIPMLAAWFAKRGINKLCN